MAIWLIYSAARAAWMIGTKFSEAFPNEKQYRRRLREESDALRLAVESVEIQRMANTPNTARTTATSCGAI
jgi:hypothetical protein